MKLITQLKRNGVVFDETLTNESDYKWLIKATKNKYSHTIKNWYKVKNESKTINQKCFRKISKTDSNCIIIYTVNIETK